MLDRLLIAVLFPFIAMYAMLVIAAFGVWGTAPIFMGTMTSGSVPFWIP